MAQDLFDYPQMVETALRGVVREALAHTAREGLRGAHHFYVSFRTDAAGVVLPDYLLAKYPDEMTIVLQNQFWGLEVRTLPAKIPADRTAKPPRQAAEIVALDKFRKR